MGIDDLSVVFDVVAVKSSTSRQVGILRHLVDDAVVVEVESHATLAALGIAVVRDCEPSVSTVADGTSEIVAKKLAKSVGTHDESTETISEVFAQRIDVVVGRSAAIPHRHLRHPVHDVPADAGILSEIAHHLKEFSVLEGIEIAINILAVGEHRGVIVAASAERENRKEKDKKPFHGQNHNSFLLMILLMSLISSSLKVRFWSVPRLFSNCATDDVPMMQLVTRWSNSTQASAICAML